MDATVKKSMWHFAGTAGILLGLTSTASMFIGQSVSTSGMSTTLINISGMILWMLETVCCIYLMHTYMKRFAAACPSANNSDTFRMGAATAFLSALVYSSASFANMAFISADMFAEQYKILVQEMASYLDSNSRVMMEKMIDKMPQITFFSNLIYCTIFGTAVGAVLSRNIPAKDPFADYKPDEQ